MPPRINTPITFDWKYEPISGTTADCAGITSAGITSDWISTISTDTYNGRKIHYPTYEHDYMITKKDLDKYLRNIYKIITEHVVLDITEEEFMELLEKDDE